MNRGTDRWVGLGETWGVFQTSVEFGNWCTRLWEVCKMWSLSEDIFSKFSKAVPSPRPFTPVSGFSTHHLQNSLINNSFWCVLMIKLQNQMVADFNLCTHITLLTIYFLCLPQPLPFGSKKFGLAPQLPARTLWGLCSLSRIRLQERCWGFTFNIPLPFISLPRHTEPCQRIHSGEKTLSFFFSETWFCIFGMLL